MNRSVRYQRSAERTTKAPALPHLESGDRLDQKTFHERYEAMPERFRAELIGGIVYVSSPQKKPHGKWQFTLIQWLATYETHTPGVEGHTGTTIVLGDGSEVQPDGCLMFAHEASAPVRNNDDDYIVGAPELIAEIAASTESIDLHGLKDDYEKAGVREYIVVALRKKRVFWFRLQRGKFKEMKTGPDGILRSVVFPGLWLDPDALVRRDRKRLLQVLHEGLASAEHAAFVAKLNKRRK